MLKKLNLKKIGILFLVTTIIIVAILIGINIAKTNKLKNNQQKLDNYLLQESYIYDSQTDIFSLSKFVEDKGYQDENTGIIDKYTFDKQVNLFQYTYSNTTTNIEYNIYYYLNDKKITIGYIQNYNNILNYYKGTYDINTTYFDCYKQKNKNDTVSEICQEMNAKVNIFSEYIDNLIKSSEIDEKLFQKK